MAELTLFAIHPESPTIAPIHSWEEALPLMETVSTRQWRVSPLRFTWVNELDEPFCRQCGKLLKVGGMALIQDSEGGAIWCRTDCAETYQALREGHWLRSNATQLSLFAAIKARSDSAASDPIS